MAVWRDAWGEEIHPGDIVEDMGTRRIGRVVYRYNKPWMDVWKEFSAAHLAYDPVERFAADEAYTRCLAPKKEWVYRLNGHRLTHVEVLKKRKERNGHAQTVTPLDMPPWEAPIPNDWMV